MNLSVWSLSATAIELQLKCVPVNQEARVRAEHRQMVPLEKEFTHSTNPRHEQKTWLQYLF